MSTPGTWLAESGADSVALGCRAEQWRDPRFTLLFARQHPLPRADWLDAPQRRQEVLATPALWPDEQRVETLRFAAPHGSRSFRIPTSLRCELRVSGQPMPLEGGSVDFSQPLAAGTPVELVFPDSAVSREGALLDGPIDVTIEPLEGPLGDIGDDLHLGAFAGTVEYAPTLFLPDDWQSATDSLEIDLGEVRGAVMVALNGRKVDELLWSPYRTVVDGRGHAGENRLTLTLATTLASYLKSASPTAGVNGGQTRSGVYGPVVVRLRRG